MLSHDHDLRKGYLISRQVIAPLLIIKRVANKSALTSNAIISGQTSSSGVRSRGKLTGGSDPLFGGDPMNSVDEYGMNSSELRVETAADFHQGST